MKKVLRIISLVLTLIMLISTFCGCTAIDEARKNHGIWQDTDKTVIALNGKEYKLLPECEYLNPSIAGTYDFVSVTDKDVPLLCKDIFGEPFLRSDDGIFLVGDSYDGNKMMSNYCLSDRYDEISGRINDKIEMEKFCYTYYDADYNQQMYYLSDEEINAVNRVIKSGEITVVGEFYDYIEIYRSSEDGIFSEYCLDLMFVDDEMYIRVQSKYFGNEKFDKYYAVPNALSKTFDKMVEKYMESY